ncbi:hypothetical protein ACFE04_003633 [Oxalis oulophora]
MAFLAIAMIFIVLSTSSTLINAMNINKILSNYPEYGTFSDLLKSTGLSEQINPRQTVTILALDNGAAGGISGYPTSEQKKILSNHVVLDYYDIPKLKAMPKKSVNLTTLYQTTGDAQDGQGFINCTKLGSGAGIVFGSAVKHSQLNSQLVGSVLSNPFNLSVLHVSAPIVAEGFVNGPTTSPPAPSPAASPPKKSKKGHNTTHDSPAPSPDDTPDSDSPSPSDDSPTSSPPGDAPDADSPSADSPDDKTKGDADAPSSSSMNINSLGLGFTIVAIVIGLGMNLIG